MNKFEYKLHVKITDAFLKKHGFDYNRHIESEVKWRYLNEETGESLRNFLKLMFGLGDDEARSAVQRSEAHPHTFFIDHFRFTAMLKRVGYFDERK